ncbi:MAG: flavodoxin domain-containing protein [Anaerolineae bacterium]
MNLLIIYASKYGSTAEIAEVIGKELQKRSHQVTVTPVEKVADVGSLAAFDGFVIGSAVYAGSWVKKAAAFLKDNGDLLAERPVWLFSSGPTGQGDPNEIMDGWSFPENLESVRARIQPEDVIFFHGKIDPEQLNFAERMIIKSVKATVGDYRDWLVIRGWAGKIDNDLKAR